MHTRVRVLLRAKVSAAPRAWRGDDFSSVILVKHNLAEVLRRELARPAWTHEHVAVGTATDPYQPIEGHYRLTRRCLENLIASRTPFSVVTKGPMVVRDLDLLVEATKQAGCEVYLSVPSVDEDAWSRLEPGTASPRQRIRAVRQLADAGVDAGILMMPLVPGITTTRSSIEGSLQAFADAGVRQVGANVARLDPGVKEHFFAFLAREYPHLVEGYRRLYPRAYASKEYAAKVKEMVRDCENPDQAWEPGSWEARELKAVWTDFSQPFPASRLRGFLQTHSPDRHECLDAFFRRRMAREELRESAGAGERTHDEHVRRGRIGVHRDLFHRAIRCAGAPRRGPSASRRSGRRRDRRRTRAAAKSPAG